MKRLSEWLYTHSTRITALVSLVVFVAFGALILPGQSAAAGRYSGDASSPDTSLFYTSADLYEMAETYGQAGRQAYVQARFTFDLAFPAVYGFFLTACVSWLLNLPLPKGSRWRLLNLLPLAAVLLDLLENISAARVIGRYPLQTPLAAALAPIFTLVKWIFVGGSFTLLMTAGALAVFRKKH